MNLGKIKFREFDRKWIAFDKEKDVKKIAKRLKLENNEGLFLGYIYISHEDGIMIKIVGNIIKFENRYLLDEELLSKDTSIPFSKSLKYHIIPVEENIIKKIKYNDEIENQFYDLYDKNSILASRKIKSIDEFRHESYIDDVELTLKTNKKEEYLWARIEDCSKDNLVFVCSLLDNSKYNKKYKKDTLVLAKLKNEGKNVDFIIEGIVDRIKK